MCMENPALNITEKQKQELKATILQDGTSAYDYVMSWPEYCRASRRATV